MGNDPMSNIVPLLGPQPVPPLSPFVRYVQARMAMVRAYVEWLETQPNSDAVQQEIDGTVLAMQQLKLLVTP